MIPEYVFESLAALLGVPGAVIVWLLWQAKSSRSQSDPADAIMGRLYDIEGRVKEVRETQLQHGHEFTRITTILEERK